MKKSTRRPRKVGLAKNGGKMSFASPKVFFEAAGEYLVF
jgi:hypothetical protein